MINIFKNPIFAREFRANVRCRKTLIFTATLLGVLSLILVTLWPRSGIFSESNSNEIFTIFLTSNLILIILLSPGFTATAITDERERGSWDMLFTSLLRPTEIMFGKLFSSLAMILLLLLISMPVTAACALSGGISLPTLTKAYLVIAAAAFTYGLLGLAISAVSRRTYAALIVTYLGIVFMAGATWLPAALFSRWFSMKNVFQILRDLSPFEALFALNYAERYEITVGGGVMAQDIFSIYLKGMLVLSLLFFTVFCIFVLRPPPRRQAKTVQQYDDSRTALRRKLGWPFYLIDPLRRKKPIPYYRNPVFVAEIRSKIFGNPKFIIRSLAGTMVVSLVLLILIGNQYETVLEADKVRCVAIIFQVGLIALLAPAVSSGSITDEKTHGTLLMLRMTPLSATGVVSGKIKASFLYVMIFLISSLPVLCSLAYLESKAAYWRIAAWLAVLLLTAVVLTAGGLCASTFAPSTGAATAMSYSLAAVLCLGTLSVLLLGTRVSPHVQSVILALNPVAAALQITSDTWFRDMPQIFGNKLWMNNLYAMSALAVLLLLVSALRVHALFRQRI